MLKADHSIDALSSNRELDIASHIESIRERNFPDYTKASAKKFSQVSVWRPKFDEDHKLWLFQFTRNNTKTPEQMRDILAQIEDMSMSWLESLPYKQKQEIAEFMLWLRLPLEIQDVFGEYMLVWLWAYIQENTRQREWLKKYLVAKTTYIWSEAVLTELNKMKYSSSTVITATDMLLGKNMLEIMPSYLTAANQNNDYGRQWLSVQLMTTHHATSLHEKKRFYRSFDAEGKNIDPLVARMDKLEWQNKISILRKNAVRKNWSGTEYSIYMDAPIGIWLFFKDKPIAVLSYTIQGYSIYIKQFQVVAPKHYDRYGRLTWSRAPQIVQDLDRQNILYDTLIDFCKQCNCHKIIIEWAENNRRAKEKQKILDYDENKERRVNKPTEQTHLSIDIAKRIYDVFAINHGFIQNTKTKDREKTIDKE